MASCVEVFAGEYTELIPASGVQLMLADMAMKVEAARLMVYPAAARAERAEPDLGFISSASKCFASDVAMEVTADAVQLFGGYGYTQDFPVERTMRDAKITQLRRHQPDSTRGHVMRTTEVAVVRLHALGRRARGQSSRPPAKYLSEVRFARRLLSAG